MATVISWASAATLLGCAAEYFVPYLENISSQKRVTCTVIDLNSPRPLLFILLCFHIMILCINFIFHQFKEP